MHITSHILGVGAVQLVECQTRDWQVAGLITGRSRGIIFFLRVNFCQFLLFVHSTLLLLQRHIKDPCYSAKSTHDRLHLNMHTFFTQISWSGWTVLSRHSVGTSEGNNITHDSSGNAHTQSSQLTEPLWTDPGISACKLISTYKKTQQEEKMLRQLTFKCKVTKIMLVMSLKIHTSHTKHTVLDLFHVCSNHALLHYSEQVSKNNLQFMNLTYL